MTPEQVLAFYGPRQVDAAAQIGISPQRLNNWISRKRVPLDWQIALHHESKGKLKLDRKRRNGRL